MNTPVSFEIAKLLFDKVFDEFCSNAIGLEYKDIVSIPFEYGVRETGYVKYGVLCNSRMDEFNSDYISCPTIAEAVMWLYKKHEIWIQVPFSYNDLKPFCWTIIKSVKDILTIDENKNCWLSGVDCNNIDGFDSPTEAYSSAIEYTLENLI